MRGDDVGEVLRIDPVNPRNSNVFPRRKGVAHGLGVLPVPYESDVDPDAAALEDRQRSGDFRCALQGREEAEEDDRKRVVDPLVACFSSLALRRSSTLGRLRRLALGSTGLVPDPPSPVSGVEPSFGGADGNDCLFSLRARRQKGAVVVGVEHDDVGRRQRSPVDPFQQAAGEPADDASAEEPPVLGRVRGEDQMVEHDGRAREEHAGEEDVEMPKVSDEDGVGPVLSTVGGGSADQPHPFSGDCRGETQGACRARQRFDPLRRSDPQRLIDLTNGKPPFAQAFEQHADARVRSNVIGAESKYSQSSSFTSQIPSKPRTDRVQAACAPPLRPKPA